MVIARKIAYNVLISSVAKIFSTFLALASIGVITRYLGKNGFGDYATVLAFLSFFSAISDFGLYQYSTREISRPGANQNEIMSNAFSMRVLLSFLILLSSFFLVYFLPYTGEVKLGIIIIAASFIFSSAYQVLNGIFQKNLVMDKVAISELLGKILQLGVIIAAVKLQLDFSWIMASLLFNTILSFILVYSWSRKYIKLTWRLDLAYCKKFLKESYPIGIMAIVVFVYFKMDTIILSMLKSNVEVGVYSVAYKVLENITFFPAMIIGLIFPIISQAIFVDREKFKDISDKTFKVFLLLTAPLAVGTLFLSDGVIQLIAGVGFSESALVLRVLVFALVAIFFSNFFNAILIAGNLQKKLMYVLSGAAVLNISSNLIFIPIYSYRAAAVTSVVTEIFVAIAAGILVHKNLNYLPKAQKAGRIFLSGLIMAAFLYFFKESSFYLRGFFSVCVYICALWLFRAVEIQELTSIISKKGVKNYEAISQS